MRHPVDLVDLDLAEVAAFHCKDLLQKLRLRVHVVVVVVASKDLITFKHILNVHWQDGGSLSNLFDR